MIQTLEHSPWIDRSKTLDSSEVERFVSEGFHVSHGLLSSTEVDELLGDAPKLIRGEYGEPMNDLDIDPSESDEQIMSKVLCMHQPHFFSPVIKKYVEHPAICSILSQLTGAHMPYWDGSVKCMQSMFFIKPSGDPGQAWHQDEGYIPTRDRSLIGAWIALDDATIENGCLWVLPKSQRSGVIFPQKDHHNNEEFDSSQIAYGFDDSAEVPVEVKRGSVVFFNGYLLHRSQKNRSDSYRRVLVNHYMSSQSLLPWRAQEGVTIAGSDVREVMNVSGSDPYGWKGYTQPLGFHYRPKQS